MAVLLFFIFRFKLFPPVFLFLQLAHSWTVAILSENAVNSWLLYDLSVSFLKDLGFGIVLCDLPQLFSPIHLFRLLTGRLWTWRGRWRLPFWLLLRDLLHDFLLGLCLLLYLSDYLLLFYFNFWRPLFLLYFLFYLLLWLFLYLWHFLFNHYNGWSLNFGLLFF